MAAEENPKKTKRLSTGSKVEQALQAAAQAADERDVNPAVGTCLRASTPFLEAFVKFLALVAPAFVVAYKYLKNVYSAAPKNVLAMAFGAALCFFGGTFVASIAAIEAFKQTGCWERCRDDVTLLLAEARAVGAASAQDDRVDANNDGVPDVDVLQPHERATHKLVLAMRTVKQPVKLRNAVGAMWGAYLAVLATLRLEFAQTTAIALGLVETVELPITRVAAPPLSLVLKPLELTHWTETLLSTALRLVAIIIAWSIQVVLSAVYSALRGGRIFADALCALIEERGWSSQIEKLPGVSAPFDPDTSYFDEAVAYTLGGLGLAWQLSTGFTLPFPLSLILLPLSIVEWLLRWQVTFGATPADPVG